MSLLDNIGNGNATMFRADVKSGGKSPNGSSRVCRGFCGVLSQRQPGDCLSFRKSKHFFSGRSRRRKSCPKLCPGTDIRASKNREVFLSIPLNSYSKSGLRG
jgi:hypothetical protein